MSAKTMAEVLVDHQRQNSSRCLCGWSKLGHSHPEHQAAALTAAGFGLVADAKAEALEESATEINSLEYIGDLPEEACSDETNAAYAAYANSTDMAEWLKARAVEMKKP